MGRMSSCLHVREGKERVSIHRDQAVRREMLHDPSCAGCSLADADLVCEPCSLRVFQPAVPGKSFRGPPFADDSCR